MIPSSLINRLHAVFESEEEVLRSDLGSCWFDVWRDYLDFIGLDHGHTDDLVELHADSPEKFVDSVIVRDPLNISGFILMSREFAEKAAVLGLPSSARSFRARESS